SDYCTTTQDTLVLLKNIINKAQEQGTSNYQDFQKDYKDYFEKSSVSRKLGFKIRLYLNQNERKHKDIIDLLNEIDSTLESKKVVDIKTEDMDMDILKIITLTRQIFKEEWEKSKKIFKL
ncbi:MAG: hypothetical protein ACKO96_15950, partial [Flammeovirgaceae bacterium]